jgi:hypothetical protein
MITGREYRADFKRGSATPPPAARVDLPGAVHSEVRVQRELIVEPKELVLAARDHLAHTNAGQIGSRQGGYPEFGSGQHAAGEHLVQPLACPPNRISLRHGLIVPWCSKPRASESADSRGSRRRSVGGEGGTTLFCSAGSDEDGGFLANIAASEASNQTQRDARAA